MANEAGFKLDTSKGGINWGYCKDSSIPNTSTYVIHTNISPIPNSGSKGPIKLVMFGTKGISEELSLLGPKGVEDGDEIEKEVRNQDIGDLVKISVKLVGSDTFRCSNIDISTPNGIFNFECTQPLKSCVGYDLSRCMMFLKPAGDCQYIINIKTVNEEEAFYRYPIVLKIFGKNGETSYGVLSQTGIVDEEFIKKLYLDDVGQITGFEIRIFERGQYTFNQIQITNTVSGEVKNFEIEKTTIMYPGKSYFILQENSESGGENSVSDLFEQSIMDDEEEQGTKPITPRNEKEKEKYQNLRENSSFTIKRSYAAKNGFNINDPNGGVMDLREKSKIIDLECDQTLENKIDNPFLFGPDYINHRGNYMNFIVRCPGNCHAIKGQVEGVGIHPESTPICLAALIDRAMSYYGGILSLSIYPGYQQYPINKEDFSTKFPNIDVIIGKDSQRSFSLAKVDNVDLFEKDYRILDYNGKLSNVGRAEVRINGVWGTFCSENDQTSAIRFCKDLGYPYGEWLNELPEISSTQEIPNDQFCEQYEGNDWCRAKGARVYFKEVSCSSGDKNINTCRKEIADEGVCSRGKDMLIKCDTISNKHEIKIPYGVVRLENAQIGLNDVMGRVEILSSQGNFDQVCDVGVNAHSANVICKQMGYQAGKIVEDLVTKSSFVLDDDDASPFAISELRCNGREKRLNNCRFKKRDINCQHKSDLVVVCQGDNGDYTGKSQYMPPPPPKPTLGKLGLTYNNIRCDTTFEDKRFRGDIGSIFYVRCPKNCVKVNAPIYGIGLYRSDSSICRAAIHSGVIYDSQKETELIVAKQNAPSSYIGMQRYDIVSQTSYVTIGNAFSVFAMNSGWKGMYKILKQKLGGNYLELEYSINSNQLVQSSSFVELSLGSKSKWAGAAIKKGVTFLKGKINQFMNKLSNINQNKKIQKNNEKYPHDLYHWVEPNKNHFFTKNPEHAYIETPKTGFKIYDEFTIFFSVTLAQYANRRQFIFSLGSCGGFNIYIENDGLFIGDPCNSNGRLQTELLLGEHDKTYVLIYFKENYIEATLIPLSYGKLIQKVYRAHTFKLEFKDQIGIGRATESDSEYNFEGKIDYIFLFQNKVQLKELKNLFKDLEEDRYDRKTPSPSNQKKYVTLDDRNCESECFSSPIPGDDILENSNESADSNNEKDEDIQIAKCMNCKKQVNDESDKKDGKNNLLYKKISSDFSIDIQCDTDLNDPRLENNIQRFNYVQVKCPDCIKEKKGINNLPLAFGSQNYHPRSSICVAALHQGLTSNFLKVTRKKGFDAFNGSLGKNKIETLSTGKSEYSFTVESGIKPIKIGCDETLQSDLFKDASINMHYFVICPKDCDIKKYPVYGSKIYSKSSSICVAGIHSGELIRSVGGEIEIVIQPETNNFSGSRSSGVVSKRSQKQSKSFSFMANPTSGASEQYDNCKGNFEDKWYTVNINKACKLFNWKYVNQNDFSEGQKKKINYIFYNDTCKIPDFFALSSVAILKRSQLSRGYYDINFRMDDFKNPIGFIFGYENVNKYYSINIIPDTINAGYNVALISKVNDKYLKLEKKNANIQKGFWYTIRIKLNLGNLSVYIDRAKSTQKTLIIKYSFKNGVSGMVGIGSNGNNKAMFSHIKISGDFEYEKKKKREGITVSFGKFVNSIEKTSYKSYFKNISTKTSYLTDRTNYGFCLSKCSSTVNPLENIRFYSCLKSCKNKVNTFQI